MNYELNFDHISILDSSLIDSESYRNENFYSLLECQSILKNIHFYIEEDIYFMVQLVQENHLLFMRFYIKTYKQDLKENFAQMKRIIANCFEPVAKPKSNTQNKKDPIDALLAKIKALPKAAQKRIKDAI